MRCIRVSLLHVPCAVLLFSTAAEGSFILPRGGKYVATEMKYGCQVQRSEMFYKRDKALS